MVATQQSNRKSTIMTQAKVRFASFEEYLAWSDDPENSMEGRYELIDGELVELPPESPENHFVTNYLFLMLVAAGIPMRLIHARGCEVQVQVLQLGDAANRYPDLVVLRPEHLEMMERRLTITLEMPPPRMAVEVVSPGKRNRDRDYHNKLAQYEAIGVDEYWIIDRQAQMVVVFELQPSGYQKIGEFQGNSIVPCLTCPGLALTAEQIFAAGQ
jgi:Uma2 family endonuclease